ncbi:MAG: hypothetical protein EZS28_053782, partial [Streblomastix strix]
SQQSSLLLPSYSNTNPTPPPPQQDEQLPDQIEDFTIKLIHGFAAFLSSLSLIRYMLLSRKESQLFIAINHSKHMLTGYLTGVGILFAGWILLSVSVYGRYNSIHEKSFGSASKV